MDFQQIRKYVKGVLTNSFLNKTTLDKLSTSKDGNLLFNGKEINSGSSGYSNMVDFDNVITTISAAKRIEYTATENCYLYKRTVATGTHGNEKFSINGKSIGIIIYTTSGTVGAYALIPLKKNDTIVIENTSDETWAWQPITIYGVVKENYLHEYSTEEKVVGKWIDGKPIYERVIHVENFIIGNNEITLENLDTIINYNGSLIISGDKRVFPFIQNNTSSKVIINDYNNTRIVVNSAFNCNNIYIIIQYTKITD